MTPICCDDGRSLDLVAFDEIHTVLDAQIELAVSTMRAAGMFVPNAAVEFARESAYALAVILGETIGGRVAPFEVSGAAMRFSAALGALHVAARS